MGRVTALLLALACLTLSLTLFSTPTVAGAEFFTMEEHDAEEITGECAYKVSDGVKGNLYNNNMVKIWRYDGDSGEIDIAMPDDKTAGLMMIFWNESPTAFTLEEYDADQSLLRTRSEQDVFLPCLTMSFPLESATRYVRLTLNAPQQYICKLRIYSDGTLPEDAQQWQAPVEKADFMVVSTHQDDELLWLGGALPYYISERDKDTIVVYMANCSRLREQEALNGLWSIGLRNYPDFVNLTDKYVKSIDAGLELWGGKERVIGLLVERIRKYKPDVVLTQDLNGEYGHPQHKITSRAVAEAVKAAPDASQYPESAAEYGTWDVKKFYIHLYEENQIKMDWDQPLESFGGKTALDMCKVAYSKHVSQQDYYQVKVGGKYDNSLFGLAYTSVGPDVAKNDMFENVVSAPIATPEPTEAPTSEPTEAPTPQPTATLEPEATELVWQPGMDGGGTDPDTQSAQITQQPDVQALMSQTELPTAVNVKVVQTTRERSDGAYRLIAITGGAVGLVVAGFAISRWRQGHAARRRRRRSAGTVRRTGAASTGTTVRRTGSASTGTTVRRAGSAYTGTGATVRRTGSASSGTTVRRTGSAFTGTAARRTGSASGRDGYRR